MCFSKQSINPPLFENLNRPLSFGERNWDLWNEKGDYLQIDELNNTNLVGHNITVLQLNICGAVSERSDLISLLDNCIKTKYGYMYYILLWNFFIRYKNASETEFFNSYSELLNKWELESNKEIILGLDHNLNLLKCHIHKSTEYFLDINLNYNILPCINRPTHITKTTSTLIDNIFVSNTLHTNMESGIMITDMSDHLPSICLLKQTRHVCKEPLKFKTRHMTEDKLNKIRNKLSDTLWH